jgi:regulatory protein
LERKAKEPRGTAKDRALRLLGVRWRSSAELQQRLRLAGFPAEEIDEAIQDLERAGLVDDARFARAVVADRAGRRLAGDREIRMALRRGGVSEDIASVAMAAAGDESERALNLARRRAARLSGLEPATAFRRLYGLLLRRGFGSAVAQDACRVALAEVLAQAPEALEHLTDG